MISLMARDSESECAARTRTDASRSRVANTKSYQCSNTYLVYATCHAKYNLKGSSAMLRKACTAVTD